VDYTTLGRTGLKVSVAGLGCGGNSRLGMKTGKTEQQSIAVVQRAIDLGVNFLDTATAYETETIVGKAIKGRPRDSVVISTKSQTKTGDTIATPEKMVGDLDASLKKLGVDYVDVFHLHGARPDHYDQLVARHLPALLKEKEKGKFRFIGITENQPFDAAHAMANRASQDGLWDVLMIAFHMLNQRPRDLILQHTIKNNIGILVMYVVRTIFSRPERLREAIRDEVAAGNLPKQMLEMENPLAFLTAGPGAAESLTDAAYRYVRHEPGCHVTLFGTGDVNHVDTNIASILRGPLRAADRERLNKEFGHLMGVGLDVPTHFANARKPAHV
jgi:aryl-alcohol dehydrogenase-like predicted oxidoreductase